MDGLKITQLYVILKASYITHLYVILAHLQNDVGSSLQYRSYAGIYDLIGKYDHSSTAVDLCKQKIFRSKNNILNFIQMRDTNNDNAFTQHLHRKIFAKKFKQEVFFSSSF